MLIKRALVWHLVIFHKAVRYWCWLSPHLLELWPVQGFSAEYVAAELGEYLTLQMEVRFKCTCYIILQALRSCHQCFYGVSTSATSAMHYTVRMRRLWRYSQPVTGQVWNKYTCVPHQTCVNKYPNLNECGVSNA